MNIKPEQTEGMRSAVRDLRPGDTLLYEDREHMLTDLNNALGECASVRLYDGVLVYLRPPEKVTLITVNATWRRSP